jgi:heptosyltransferase-2
VPEREIAEWRVRNALADEKRPIVALCPGAVGAGKRWPETSYAELARRLTGEGIAVWVLGGPGEK